jgi:hypothetical protein
MLYAVNVDVRAFLQIERVNARWPGFSNHGINSCV